MTIYLMLADRLLARQPPSLKLLVQDMRICAYYCFDTGEPKIPR